MSQWINRLLVVLLVAGIATAALAQSSADGLREIFRFAQLADRTYLSAQAQYRATLEKLPQARAGLLPNITASANSFRYDSKVDYEDRRFQDVDRKFDVDGWNLALKQPLFRVVNIIQYTRAQLQVEQAQVQLQLAKGELLGRVTKSLVDWQSALRHRDALLRTKAHFRTFTERVRSGQALQLATVPDLLEAEARQAKVEADLLMAEQDVVLKTAVLARALGRAPDAEQRYDYLEGPWPKPQWALKEWKARAAEQNLQVRSQILQVSMAEKDVAAARAGHLPTVDFVVNGGRTNNSGSTALLEGGSASVQKQVGIGVQMEMPLFLGGSVLSRTDEALAMLEKAREDLENTRQGVELDVQSSYTKVEVGLVQVAAARKLIKATEAKLAAARSGQAQQTSLELDVLMAHADLLSAQRDLYKVQGEILLAYLQLWQASGELDDEALEAWAKLLAPVKGRPS